MKKTAKGDAGYVSYEKKKRALITLVMFAIPLTIYFSGWAYAGTRKNVLPPSTAQLLSERKKKSFSEWIFPDPLHPERPTRPNAAYVRMKALLAQAGLPSIRFHDLRHTFATHALANGVDAKTLSSILGHTKASFTLDTYTHTTGDMQKRASEIVGGFLTDYLGEEMAPWQNAENTATAVSA